MEFSGLLDRLRDVLGQRGLAWREVRGGIALEFRDGCDAWFVTPDNLRFLTPATSEDSTPDVRADWLVDEFQRIDQTRWQVLIGLRHYAVGAKMAFLFCADGQWGVDMGGGCTGSIHVGSVLTRLARELDPASALIQLVKNSLLKKLSPRRAARLVAFPDPPPQELRWRGSDETAVDFDPTFYLSFDCSVLEDGQFEGQSPEAVAAALTRPRNSPGFAVIQELIARLGKECFSVDLCGKGGGDFDFTDKLDQLWVFPRGKRMAHLVEKHGVERLVDLLANEYRHLDRARARLLRGLKAVMASHGLALDDRTHDGTWWFGATHRQFQFNPRRPLTLKLRKHSPAEVLSQWITATQACELPSPRELSRLIDGLPQEPSHRTLPQHPPGQGPRLPPLDSLDLSELDRKAAELVGLLKRQAESPDRGCKSFDTDLLFKWSDPLWYRRGLDDWTDDRWWVNLAERAWETEQHQHAALLLMLNGDDRPRATLVESYRQMDGYFHEDCDDGAVWLLRNQIPWRLDEDGEFPKYPSVLGSPPPEVARPIAMRVRQEIRAAARGGNPDTTPEEHLDRALAELSALDPISGGEWLEPPEIELLHEHCRRWAARNDDFYSLREETPLDVAARFGWGNVVDVLDQNAAFEHAILESDLVGIAVGSVAQRLSLIAPGTLAARFGAYAINLDPEAGSRAVAHEIAQIAGNVAYIEAFQKGVAKSYRAQQAAGAIAWLRCGRAMTRSSGG